MDNHHTFPVDPLGAVLTSTLIAHLLARFRETNALEFVSNDDLLDLWSLTRGEAFNRADEVGDIGAKQIITDTERVTYDLPSA